MHTCGNNISISEILYHYHDMENYIDISILILHIINTSGVILQKMVEKMYCLFHFCFVIVKEIKTKEQEEKERFVHIMHVYNS